MNSKGHLVISLIKSGIRIVGSLVAINTKSVHPIAACFLLAEILGVLEEIVDKR